MQLAERYCSVERWRTKLDKVTAACGLESLACRRDALPVRGGQTVIFRIQEEAIVKFYAKDAQVANKTSSATLKPAFQQRPMLLLAQVPITTHQLLLMYEETMKPFLVGRTVP